MPPTISILIRTFNSAGTLADVLARLELQPGDEILVVDSGSTDATLEIARRHHARILVAEKPFNYGKSLNLGFRAAKNPWVLVISSHCVPVSGNLVEVFRRAAGTFPPAVAVAYGDYDVVERPGTAPVLLADQSATAAQRRGVYGGNGLALYRHDSWRARPFDEALFTGEDLAWFLRALAGGAMAARVPQARALYRNQGSLRHMFRKGWLESRQEMELTGAPGLNLFQLGIWWGSLLKKWVAGKIPASVLLRQGAHALGAYLSPKFSSRQKNTGKTG